MSRALVLCLGDLHLGLPPSRLPPDADARQVATAAVWLRAVDRALDRGADLVLLSGDVVDRDNRYFEAFGPLDEGLRRLAEAGIPVCAVAGNHDAEVLDRLERAVADGRMRLLGARRTDGGEDADGADSGWERFTLEDGAGRPLLHVDGWSFPSRDVRKDPVALYDLPRPDDGAPVLGLVHGDLDRPESTNAPFTKSSLARAPVDAWLLGHIHKPGRIELPGGRWALYPGSPQPLDPTETGVHGVWEVEVEGGTLGAPRQVALQTVRYERIQVDLTGTETVDDARGAIARTVRDRVAALDLPGGLEWLVLRAELTGRTGAHGALDDLARRLEGEDPLELVAGEGRARLTEVLVRTRPAVDLEARAGADDPVGVVADLLLALGPDAGSDAGRALPAELLRAAREREREADGHAAFSGLRPGTGREEWASENPDERTRRRLARVAASLLDALLETKEEHPGRAGEAERPEADGR